MPDLVLVVEDDPANAVLVEAILTAVGGFDVVCSDDGDEVIRVVHERPVKAVLMDVSLGNTRVADEKVDGVELTRRLRDLPEGINLPVIILTAHAMKGDRERLLFESSANDYVAKPIIDQQGLVSLVKRHIRAAQAVKEELHKSRTGALATGRQKNRGVTLHPGVLGFRHPRKGYQGKTNSDQPQQPTGLPHHNLHLRQNACSRNSGKVGV